jgi:hypothetical protein
MCIDGDIEKSTCYTIYFWQNFYILHQILFNT